jgi:putative hydrolase of the HAD superfamily
MTAISTILWDVGGVLLTNGWDHNERHTVLSRFQVQQDAFEQRHPEANDAWEKGLLTVEEYLHKTIFYEPRSFSQSEFLDAMKAESIVLEDSALDILGQLAASKSFKLGMLNNEARELNDYRIDTFKLRNYFELFLSSCYVGLRKPEPQMFQLAIDVLKRDPAEIAFVDDRAGNVAAANAAGMHAIQYKGAAALKTEFEKLNIKL